eukprot:1054647-Rhodomonas_salina.1
MAHAPAISTMCGTDIGYAICEHDPRCGTEIAYACGTEIAYAATEIAYAATEIAYDATEIAYTATRQSGG